MKKTLTPEEMLDLAAKVMIEGHYGQRDKAGQPYFQHPMRVALNCETLTTKTVALLHDIIEDTPATEQSLLDVGFTDEVVSAILGLTRKADETYDEFIVRCSQNPISAYVKIRDLRDNLDVMRLSSVSPDDAERLNKYLRSLRYLQSKANKD